MEKSDKTVYDLLLDHLKPGERVNRVIFYDTMVRRIPEKGQYVGVQVPLDQPLRMDTARRYLQQIKHDKLCPKIRFDTTTRILFFSPAEIATELTPEGYLAHFTLNPVVEPLGAAT